MSMTGLFWILFGLGCSENQTPYAPYTWETSSYCLPNVDGSLSYLEFPLSMEGAVSYRVASQVSLDFTLGKTEMGTSIWDFSADLDMDDMEIWISTVQTQSDSWYVSEVPAAAWVIPNDSLNSSVGLYSIDEQALWLHAVVDSEDSEQNRSIYTQPTAILRFPMAEGDRFESQGEVLDGVSNGLPFNGIHTYTVEVKERGELWLPNFRFTDVYRVNTLLTVTGTAGNSFSIHQSSFFSECFGELVRLQSPLNAPDFSFETIDALRVLDLQP